MVELLVVIGIIAVLISILFPALQKARTQAVQIRCANNLKQWGLGLQMYANDNKGHLFIPYSNGTCPGIAWTYNGSAQTYTGNTVEGNSEFTVERMAPYVGGGFNQNTPNGSTGGGNNCTLFGPWVDPSVTDDIARPGWFWPGAYCAAWMHYAYFGGVDRWGTEGGAANIATAAQLNTFVGEQFRPGDSDRVLMCDLLVWFGGNYPNQWCYNHGFVGSGNNAVYIPDLGLGNSGTNYDGPVRNVSGINELFGDGHVIWKSNGDLRTDLLSNTTTMWNQPYAVTSGSGACFY